MGERLIPMIDDNSTITFRQPGGRDEFTVWMDTMPSRDGGGYQEYVLHVEESMPGCRIAGVHAYDDMVAEFDRMVAVLETGPSQATTNGINEQMIVLLANFVALSRVPTPPEPEPAEEGWPDWEFHSCRENGEHLLSSRHTRDECPVDPE